MKAGRPNRVSLPLNEAIKHDLVFFNNSVLIQGLALTPAIAGATSLSNAVILSLAIFLLVIPTRVISEFLLTVLSKLPRMRAIVYVTTSAIVYIPAYFILNRLFGAALADVGILLPLLFVDGIVISRAEIPARENFAKSLQNGFFTAFGASLVLLILGSVREILGEGEILNYPLFDGPLLSAAGTVTGGLILTALFAALFQAAAGAYKRERFIVEVSGNE